MAHPINFSSVALVDGAWLFTWDAVGLTRLVVWGTVLEEGYSARTYSYAGSLYSTPTVPPPLEVMVGNAKAPSEVNECVIVLQWYGSAGAVRYDIERYNGSAWVPWSSVPHADDTWLYTVGTPVLDDQELTQWRVVAVDENLRESDPLSYAHFVVRPPDVPAAPEVSCAAGTLTVQ